MSSSASKCKQLTDFFSPSSATVWNTRRTSPRRPHKEEEDGVIRIDVPSPSSTRSPKKRIQQENDKEASICLDLSSQETDNGEDRRRKSKKRDILWQDENEEAMVHRYKMRREARLCSTQEGFERSEGYLAVKHRQIPLLRVIASMRDKQQSDWIRDMRTRKLSLTEYARETKGSAYSCHLRYMLDNICLRPSVYRTLFRHDELELAECLLRLPEPHFGLIARIFMRKGPWFYVLSILGYRDIFSNSTDNLEEATQIIKQLNQQGLLLTLEEVRIARLQEQRDRILDKYVLLDHDENVHTSRAKAYTRHAVCALTSRDALHKAGVSCSMLALSDLMCLSVQSLVALEICSSLLTNKQLQHICTSLGMRGDTTIPNPSCANNSASTSVARSFVLRSLETIGFPKRKAECIASCMNILGPSSNCTTCVVNTKKSTLLRWLVNKMLKQKGLFGNELPLAQRIQEVVDSRQPVEYYRSSDSHFFRFPRALRHLLLRVHRLFYVTGFTAALSSGHIEGEWTYGGNSVQQHPDNPLLTSDDCWHVEVEDGLESGVQGEVESVELGPPQFSPGLLEIFKKMKFPHYQYFSDVVLFRSKGSYFVYEAALAFRNETVKSEVLSSKASTVLAENVSGGNAVQDSVQTAKFDDVLHIFEPISGAEISNLLCSPSDQVSRKLLNFALLQDVGHAKGASNGRHALSTVLSVYRQSIQGGGDAKKCSFYRLCLNFVVGLVYPELLVAMRASSCLFMAHLWKNNTLHLQQQNPSTDTGYVCFEERQHSEVESTDHIRQLDGCTVFVSILWDAIDCLEKKKLYSSSILYLRQLLALPYTPHRRGKWWMRLSLDLAHLGLLKQSVEATVEGCCDSTVRGGDKLALWKRLRRLGKQANGKLNFGLLSAVNSITQQKPSVQDVCGIQASQDDIEILARGHPCLAATEKSFSTAFATLWPSLKVWSMDNRIRMLVETRLLTRGVPRTSFVMRPLKSSVGETHVVDKPLNKSMGMKSRFLSTDPYNDVSEYTQSQETGLDFSSGCFITDHVWLSLIAWHFLVDSSKGDSKTGNAVYRRFVKWLINTSLPAMPHLPSRDKKMMLKAYTLLSQLEQATKENKTAVCSENCSLLWAIASSGILLEDETDLFHASETKAIDGINLLQTIDIDSEGLFGTDLFSSVELRALEHYSTTAHWRGSHCEGRPLVSLFGLLFWDIIFNANVEDGVFVTAYQDAPLDIDSMSFFRRRESHILCRLQEILHMNDHQLASYLADSYTAHFGEICRDVNWQYPLGFLQMLVCGLGARVVGKICYALSMNHKHLSSGLPDLLLWRISLPGYDHRRCNLEEDDEVQMGNSGNSEARPPYPSFPGLEWAIPAGCGVQVKLVEVKGPRDRLSDKQNAWLQVLSSAGADVEVCYIRER
eukprot:gb/GECG01006706.1/.p1 GENE.gb/GECG01006706.1/~~gb/GECG01006706.1/.p1  ORF type:complete len:1399 (+),score=160.66 gb/GECG01006706.1/:1-4197(+)